MSTSPSKTPSTGWDAFIVAETVQEPTGVIDAFDFGRVTLVEVAVASDGSAEFLAVGWKVENGWPTDATVGVIQLTALDAQTLRSMISRWPPGEHDFVFEHGRWPPMRPTLAGRYLDRVAEVDPKWHSQILGELARFGGCQPGKRIRSSFP